MAHPDTLFLLLHQATPIHKRGNNERQTVSNIIAQLPYSTLGELFGTYRKCRSQEPWVQKLIKSEKRFKTKESLLTKFRTTCIQALSKPDMWCDLYIATIWSEYTDTSLQICTVDGIIILQVLRGKKCLTLMQPSSSSCAFSRINKAVSQVGDISEGAERMIRQCVRASRYTLNLDGATGKVARKKEVTQKLKNEVTQVVTQDESVKSKYIINPATGRKVKVGSRTHKSLMIN